jgi:hypothetical protein
VLTDIRNATAPIPAPDRQNRRVETQQSLRLPPAW